MKPLTANRCGATPGRPGPARRRAFTLIEIMIVVGIMGLIAAMGMPSILSAFRKEGMRKAVDDFTGVCFSAREQAIMFNKTVAVVIYPAQNQFGVEGTSLGTPVNTHSGRALIATLPSRIQFGMVDIYRRDFSQSETVKIFFSSDGTCDEAVIVLVGNGGAESRKITLDYATGMPVISAVDQ